jgi:hypothetical protein
MPSKFSEVVLVHGISILKTLIMNSYETELKSLMLILRKG